MILRNVMHNTQLKKCTCLWSFIQVRCPEKVVTICIKINFNRAQNLFLVLYTSQIPRGIILFLKVNDFSKYMKKQKWKPLTLFFLKILIYFWIPYFNYGKSSEKSCTPIEVDVLCSYKRQNGSTLLVTERKMR